MPDRIAEMISRSAADPFWSVEAGEGLGGLHAARALERAGLELADLSSMPGDELEGRLRSALGAVQPGLAPDEIRARSRRILLALAEALYQRAEGRLRAQAGALMGEAARALRAVAAEDRRSLRLLEGVLGRPTRTARQAGLEALGLDRHTAEGLEIRASNPGASRLRAQLEAGRAALPGRGPLGLPEVQACLRRSADGLDRLRRELEAGRGVDVFVRCPALTRGLLQGLDGRGLLAETLQQRLAHHARCQRADEALLALTGLLLDLGALLSGGGLAAASVLYDLGVAAGTLGSSGRRWDCARLGALAGVLEEADLVGARSAASRADGVAFATALASPLPASTALVLGAERLDVERSDVERSDTWGLRAQP